MRRGLQTAPATSSVREEVFYFCIAIVESLRLSMLTEAENNNILLINLKEDLF